MILNICDISSDLVEGAKLLAGDLQIEYSMEDGIPVFTEKSIDGNLALVYDGIRATIRYREKVHFYRALGLLVEQLKLGRPRVSISEAPRFKLNGLMVDVSRNAVLTEDSIRRLLRMLALMGMNGLMLYTEDTITVDGYPYFGYMRGRYRQVELRAYDDYADLLGIEMIPCIQTLAYLRQALQWNAANTLRDTEDILLVGAEETYDWIEAMIRTASAPCRSKRIHIGMDEAKQIGRGAYLDANGYREPLAIMNEHLKRVLATTDEQGLEPMIWSDMLLGSSALGEHDSQKALQPDENILETARRAQCVYWDYYQEDEQVYQL